MSDIFKKAKKGQIYVCGACGKTSKTKAPSKDSEYGWDESCMLASVLCEESSIERGEDNRVSKAIAIQGEEV